MDELLGDFLTETQEGLSTLEQNLLTLECDPENKEVINQTFRILHTIKGTCGFLGLSRLEKVAHVCETILSKVREDQLKATGDVLTVLLKGLDLLKEIVQNIENISEEGQGDDSAVIKELEGCIDQKKEEEMSEEEANALFQTPSQEAPSDVPQDEQLLCCPNNPPLEPTLSKAPEVKVEPKPQETKESAPKPATDAKTGTAATQSIRVNVDTLDNLMTLVSELVLTRNQLAQVARQLPENLIKALLSRLSQITSDLQEEVMKTRMQPIQSAWAKVPRLVRDLSGELHKKVQLVEEGGDTELDRQILELIKDPLIHMIRNSMDHGFESPEERLTNGKSDTGILKLTASQEGGYVLLKISDDGKGLNVDRIQEKILEKGLADRATIAQMTQEQLFQYIFHPGFSTAKVVSNVSGRGVGMDVVRTNIEQLGGSVQVLSKQGIGSDFVLRIPSTLSIISSLIIKSGGFQFALPQASVTELVRVGGLSGYQVEMINHTPILRLRERIIPLLVLNKILDLGGFTDEEILKREHHVVVMQVDSRFVGVLVDQVCDTYEIVVKPLAKSLRSLKIFSGSTILGGGEVILIVDPHTLYQSIGEELSTSEKETAGYLKQAEKNTLKKTNSILLLLKAGGQSYVVPLSLVGRIDEITLSDLCPDLSVQTLPYQGKLLPIMSLNPMTTLQSMDGSLRPMLVFMNKTHALGVVVEEISDIIHGEIEILIDSDIKGSMGLCMIKGEKTHVINTDYFFQLVYPNASASASKKLSNSKKRILLVDDSEFFRNALKPVLSLAGYDVTTSDCPTNAMTLMKDTVFDLLITDIEMPDMNGFEFARTLRQLYKDDCLPIIALSAMSSSSEVKVADMRLFDDFVSKSDQQSLLHVIKISL
ncbi:MAG TPA: hybrid sensor histidine kinase/response regulator, partial [Alphaproteobacteria bacterium]|nr:hybrid sensor histidine kinase/response regulator [Alphaproteobacteria bacterium]